MPELRIVDDAPWQAVKDRQNELAVKYASTIEAIRAAHANRLDRTHRPRSLLSGLLACGTCGGSHALPSQGGYGCSGHVMNSCCDNCRIIRRTVLKERLLAGLEDRLMAPEVAAEAMRANAEETNRLNHERRSAVASGRKELAGIYRRNVERLAEALSRPEDRDEASAAIRGFIERITLSPGPKRGHIVAVLYRDLGTIIEWTAARTARATGPGETKPTPPSRECRSRWLRGQDASLRTSGYGVHECMPGRSSVPRYGTTAIRDAPLSRTCACLLDRRSLRALGPKNPAPRMLPVARPEYIELATHA